jgi:hypothetical protein
MFPFSQYGQMKDFRCVFHKSIRLMALKPDKKRSRRSKKLTKTAKKVKAGTEAGNGSGKRKAG